MNLLHLPGLMLRAISDADALAWLALTVGLGWAVLPIFHALLPRLRIGWYFAARAAALALLAYLGWILSHHAASASLDDSGHSGCAFLEWIGNGPGLIVLDRQGTAVVLLLLLIVSAFAWRWWGRATLRSLRSPRRRRFLLAGEACFFLFFLLGGALRLVSHGLVDQEKFMDAAFLKSCIYAFAMPPGDPWLFDLPINYYYGGFLIMAMPAKLLGTPPEIACNLAIALEWGLAAALVFALAAELVRKVRWATLAVVVVLVAGNLAVFPQVAAWLRSSPPLHSFSFNWWEPSRVIHDHIPGAAPQATINEFPFFAFYHADLHPHLLAIPFALVLAAAVMHLFLSMARTRTPFGRKRGGALARFLFTAWCLGWLAMINGFDFIAWTFAVAVALLLVARWTASTTTRPYPFYKCVLLAVALVAVSVAFFYPFWVNFHPPIDARSFDWNGAIAALPGAIVVHLRDGMPIGLTEFRTRSDQFLLVWGAWILAPMLLGLLEILRVRGEKPREIRFLLDVALVGGSILAVLILGGWVAGAIAILIAVLVFTFFRARGGARSAAAGWLLVTGLALLLLCELVFLRDSYGRGLQRMNTVFKFHFVAWILLGISFPFCVRELWRSPVLNRAGRTAIGVAMTVLLIVAAAYPVLAIHERVAMYEQLSLGPPDYDGLRFLRRDLPGDYAAILWLRENAPPGAILAEATGPPYSMYARISTFAPVRSLLGWANHQRVWRGELSPEIETDARAIYESPSFEAVRPLLDRYHVDYVYVGALERRDYPPEALAKFDSSLPVAWRDPVHDTVIYQVPGQSVGESTLRAALGK